MKTSPFLPIAMILVAATSSAQPLWPNSWIWADIVDGDAPAGVGPRRMSDAPGSIMVTPPTLGFGGGGGRAGGANARLQMATRRGLQEDRLDPHWKS